MEFTPFLMFPIMGIFLTAVGVLALSFSIGLMSLEQKRHNKVIEQILAEIRDRQPEFLP